MAANPELYDDTEYGDYGDNGDYGDYSNYAYDYDTPKDRVISHVDVLVWLVFPFASLGLLSSLLTLIFVALFPKPLKTTIIHCIVLCVVSILTCMISIAQASSWEIKADLTAKAQVDDFIIVDFAISWITILIVGVSNWLFVAFLTVRLYSISKVNINRYADYVAASANDVNASPTKPFYVCRVVLVILFFGWLIPTFILPLIAMIEYYTNWLDDNAQVIDVLGFAFKHDFNHRWGSTIYVLLPLGIAVILSAIIVFLTATKIRGLKFMSTKWDKAKLTLGAIFIFFVSRIPMLIYVFFALQAYPPAPKKTGDATLDQQLAQEHTMWTLVGNLSVKDKQMGPTAPICLVFVCAAAALNFPLFYASFHRFRSLCARAMANCRNGGACCEDLDQRSDDTSEGPDDVPYISHASPTTTASFIATPVRHLNPQSSSPLKNSQTQGNFFFNSAHLQGHDFNVHLNENGFDDGNHREKQ